MLHLNQLTSWFYCETLEKQLVVNPCLFLRGPPHIRWQERGEPSGPGETSGGFVSPLKSGVILYGGFHKWGYPKMVGLCWFVYLMDNSTKMDDYTLW